MSNRIRNRRRVVAWPWTAIIGLLTLLALSLTTAGAAFAQTTIDLHDFNPYPNGAGPNGVIQGSDGNFYGTAGGGDGTIFKITTAGVLTTLHSFTGSDGAGPNSLLVQGSDGNFYGATAFGGVGYTGNPGSGYGTIFQITPSGVLTTLHSFTGVSDGSLPTGSLIQGSDGNFYGTTTYGGPFGDGSQLEGGFGTVFKITPTGVLTTLHSFTDTGSDGARPYAGLVQGSDGNFYGTTEEGGSASDGTIFQITPLGVLTTLYSFTGPDGASPYASLLLGTDGNFYGTTAYGGTFGDGTVFQITPAGVLTSMYSFSGPDGQAPGVRLIQGSDGNFYGTTAFGGTGGDGSIFQITPAGVLTTLYSFRGSFTGSNDVYPNGDAPDGLIQGSDGNFYGTTGGGGSADSIGDGTVFQLTPSGVLTTLYAFTDSDGAQPIGNLAEGSDGNFYGTTQNGGTSGFDDGIVFQITPTGAETILHTFMNSDGAFPSGGLIQGSDGDFYGTTYGTWGTVFQMTPAGFLNTLYQFSGGDIYPGAGISGVVQGSDGNFYGTTPNDGAFSDGSVFQLTPAGVLTTLYSFSGPDGAVPMAGLVQGSDGNFYGTTQYGGAGLSGFGTVFKITPAGVLTTLHSFTNGSDGNEPAGNLVQGSDGNFYGTTLNGGGGEDGVVFKITSAGVLTALHSFTGIDGAYPSAGLIQGTDGDFYGTTQNGGVGYAGNATGDGTVFQITPSGVLTTLHMFSGLDGGSPNAALTLGTDGNLYGTAEYGGLYGEGIVFALAFPATPANLTATPGNAQVTLSWTSAADATGYNVYRGTTSGGEGGTSIASDVSTTSYVDATVTNNVTYYYEVTALNAGGETAVSNEASATPELPIPAAPTGVTAAAGISQVTVTWAASPGAASYSVYRGTASGGEGGTPISSGLPATSYTDTNVTNGMTYYYEVTATNTGGTSGFSTEVLATPQSTAPPPVANNDSYTDQENQTLTVAAPGVLGNDTDDFGDPLTLVLVTTTSNGSLTLNPDGSFTYTPNAGFLGTDTFTYQARDAVYPALLSNVATVSITTSSVGAIYSFMGSDGTNPLAGLTQGTDGNFYGVDSNGGADGYGTVYQVTPAGVMTTLYSFTGRADGGSPTAQMVLGGDGNLYGTTSNGGSNGNGTIFQITLGGSLTTIYPSGGGSQLIVGTDGDLYGTTVSGGANNAGSIFKIALDGSGYTTLYSFSGTGPDGGNPYAGLTLASDGNYYGTTTELSFNGAGTIFQFTPSGTLTTLHTFNGTDGFNVQERLIQGSDGSLYGTSPSGGNGNGYSGIGSIFKITTSGVFTTLHTFEGPDGVIPFAGLTLASDGNFYGVTLFGGANGAGVVYQISQSGSFLTVYSFDYVDAFIAEGTLIQGSDGSLYGTSAYGGADGQGSVFSVDLGLQPAASPVTVVTPASATPNPVTGKTTSLSVLGGWTGTGGAAALTYTWSSTGPGSVSFSANGTNAAQNSTATFTQAGTYTLTATIASPSGSTTSSVNVTVNQTLTSVSLTPGPTLTLTCVASQTFTATANDQFGNPLATQPAFTWALIGTSVGSLTNGAYSTGGTPGTATVRAKTGAISASVVVTVNPAPVTVATPASATPNPALGRTTNLNVVGGYAGKGGPGVLIYTWSSTGPAPVTFSANGTDAARNSVATFAEAGSYTFTANIVGPYGSTASTVNVTVNQTYTSVSIVPGPTVTLTAPAAQQFTATADDQFGNPLATQPAFAWSLAAGSVGSVASQGGLYHSGTVAGSATVKAKSGSISGTVSVTVNPVPVTVVTAAAATPSPVGATMTNLSVLGGYAGTGGAASLVYTWTVSGPGFVTFSANGTNAARNTTATFALAGSYTFTATIASPYTSTTSSVTVTVDQTLSAITVSPGPTLTLGTSATQQFTATGLDQFGNTLATQPAFGWTLASGSVGSIGSTTGLYHSGTVDGTATVKAKSGTVSGTCAVTVN